MKYLCIDSSNPEPQWFYGKWIHEMESYEGEMTANGLSLDDVPGQPSLRHGGCFCFRPNRFIVDPEITPPAAISAGVKVEGDHVR